MVTTPTETATVPSRVRVVPHTATRQLTHLAARVGTYTILLVLAVLTIFPVAWMALTSVKQPNDVFGGSLLPSSLNLANYPRVWATVDFPRHFFNSLFVTALTVLLVVVVATMAGYAFARFRFRGRDVIFYLFLASMMIPGQTILIPMYILLQRIGLQNTLPGLSLSYLGGSLPFAIFLMRAFFQGLPSELADAGRIDGCTNLGVFLRIFLPLARPGIATITIFQFVNTWNEFLFATTFISTPEVKTLQSALYNAVGQYSTDWTALSTGLVMSIIPLVIVYVVLQRQFIQGLTAGAIKG